MRLPSRSRRRRRRRTRNNKRSWGFELLTILPRRKARCSADSGAAVPRTAAGTPAAGNPAEVGNQTEDTPAAGKRPSRTLQKHDPLNLNKKEAESEKKGGKNDRSGELQR